MRSTKPLNETFKPKKKNPISLGNYSPRHEQSTVTEKQFRKIASKEHALSPRPIVVDRSAKPSCRCPDVCAYQKSVLRGAEKPECTKETVCWYQQFFSDTPASSDTSEKWVIEISEEQAEKFAKQFEQCQKDCERMGKMSKESMELEID